MDACSECLARGSSLQCSIVEINLQSYFGIIAILSGLWVIWSTLSNLVPISLSLKCILLLGKVKRTSTKLHYEVKYFLN